MMEWMRKSAPGIILVVVLVFGATSFVGFGFDAFAGKDGKQGVGSIGKDKISLVEFSNAYRSAENNLRDQEISGAERRQLPLRVWEELVSTKIGEKAAAMLKLEATSEEVLASLLDNPPSFLMQSPYFADSTGKFSMAKYRQIMSMPETYASPEVRSIEEYTRSMIPNMKLAMILEMSNVSSPSEIEEQYRRVNDKVQFEYLICRPYSMTVAPEKLNEKAVSDYYAKMTEKFKSEDKAELFFIKISKAATAKDEIVITGQVAEIKAKLLAGESQFNEEAEYESDDEQSAAKGGEIGWLKKGDFPEFDSLFTLPAGTMAGPIKSRLGIHLVKVDSVKGTGDSLQISIRHILKKITPTVETLDSLDALGAAVLRVAESGDLVGAATKNGLRLDSAGLFGRGDAVPGMGEHSTLGQFVFDNVKDSSVELFENEEGIYIAKVKERVEKGRLPLTRVEKDIRQILRDSMQLEAAVAYMTTVASKVNNGSLKAYALVDTTLMSGETGLVTRNEFVSGVGFNNRVIASAFLTKAATVSKPIKEDNGVYLVRPVTHAKVTTVPKEAVKQLAAEMKAKRASSVYQEWYMSFRELLGVKENVRQYFY